ncbi:MAG TPA: ATP-binding protein [Terriglobales bacterium]|nr:ATP-binding protein [Terriglobales bacterium]
MSRFNPFLWPKQPVVRSYAIALLSVSGALIISRVQLLHLETAPVSLFLCAVMLSSWFGGVRPGLLATILSGLAFDYYVLSPTHSLAVKPEEVPRLIVFTVSALFVALLSAAQRSATESLRSTRDELKEKVQELQSANKALQAESRELESAQESLRRGEGYLADAQRLSHTGSWARTADTDQMTYWSEECYRVLGFDPHGGPPRFEALLQRVHPEDRAKVKEITETARREKAEYELEYRIVHPGGDVCDIHMVGHPVLSASGDLIEFVGTVMDVTERKRAEESLRQAQADLAHVHRVTTMGELTASLAHEVNQPIAAAVTNANTCLRWLTRDQPDLEEARAAAMRIVKDGTRAAEIIKRIRLLFKKETSQRELVDINDVIREMMVLLRGEAMRHSILVRSELEENTPQVVADRVQLQRVLMNLMVNGIDAMKEVGWARELVIKSQHDKNGQAFVSVNDTGVGLPPQSSHQVFEAFFTTKPHGTGMGLSISRSIIESHGGRLWAASNPPHGASFCFSLPSNAEAKE